MNAGRSTVEISTALADLRLTRNAVGGKHWLSDDLAREPAAPLGSLGTSERPLSALDSAGCGFLTPMVSFLEEPLGQLRGEPRSVTGPAGDHDGAARDADAVADDYGATAHQETSSWTGSSKQDYSATASKLVDGIKSVAESAATNAKAMVAAGEVVAQAADIVTRLITEAVGQIVPIMTEAIAAAPATFGASIAQAIPQCVAIAADYGGRIAAKLAALLASGENLVKLLEGAAAALDVVETGLKTIGDLAGGSGDGKPGSAHGADAGTGSSAQADSGSRVGSGTGSEAGFGHRVDSDSVSRVDFGATGDLGSESGRGHRADSVSRADFDTTGGSGSEAGLGHSADSESAIQTGAARPADPGAQPGRVATPTSV